MLTQGLFLLAFALATGAIALINNFIKAGSFTRRTNRRESALLDFSDQVRYFTEDSRDNCRNSLIFKKMTGRHAPIRIINLILSCYDPHLATYIYAKAPRYVHFQRSELENWQLQEPAIVRNRFLQVMLWLMLLNGLVLLGLSGHLLTLLVIGFRAIAPQPSLIRFALSAVAFLLCIGMIAISYCQYAYREMVFLDLVKTFYEDKPANSRALIRTVFNGPVVNEPTITQINGSRLNVNGSRLNGSKLNGSKLNGSKLNGPRFNGSRLNGSKLTRESGSIS
ncbi:MAG: pentapeptide repeat-containing protein [Phormidesmis sp.]